MEFIRRNWWPVIIGCVVGIFLLAWWLTGWLGSVAKGEAADALALQKIENVTVAKATGANGYGHNGLDLVLEGPPSAQTASLKAVGVQNSVDKLTYKTSAEKVTVDLNQLFEVEPIQFSSARAEIRTQSYSTLDQAAQFLALDPTIKLRVVGHTDSDGEADANLALSQARAESVVDYLVSKGVEPSRLTAQGRGETELLIDPELTPADKQKNRRINWELED